MVDLITSISKKVQDQYVNEYATRLSDGKDAIEKGFITMFFEPGRKIQGELKELNHFLKSIKDKSNVPRFIELISNFNESKVYERFMASAMIYSRTDNFQDSFDKFLYLCIAIEAAMNYEISVGKKKSQLFREFFTQNISEKSKLKMISNFHTKHITSYFPGSALTIHEENDKLLEKFEKKENLLVPECFKKKQCYIDYGQCYPDIKCAIKSDSGQIEGRLFFVIDYLYNKRSKFVHEGKVFSHPMSRPADHFTDAGIGDVYLNPTTSKYESIHYGLDLNDLYFIFEEALYIHFKTINQAVQGKV